MKKKVDKKMAFNNVNPDIEEILEDLGDIPVTTIGGIL